MSADHPGERRAGPVASLAGVRHIYGGTAALDGVTLDIPAGRMVGFLGPDGVGKSTLLASMSAARPKIADYPFTTLYPQPGVVAVDPLRSFVMVDIPGLIAGAADGAGLGHRFLRHLSRTRLLLQLVDLMPPEGGIAEQVRTIADELAQYSETLGNRPRWLVFNKADLLDAEAAQAAVEAALAELGQDRPCFIISAATGQGLEALGRAVMDWLEARRAEEAAAAQAQEATSAPEAE